MTGVLRRLSREDVDGAIAEWGLAQAEAMRRESRGSLSSELFDVRGRTWVGFECFFEAAPALLRELGRRIAPEEIGARMRRPGSRPYYLQLFILMSNYLCAREQRILATGRKPECDDPRREEDVHDLVEFFVRTASAYRLDGRPAPSGPRADQRVLEDEWVERCAALLGDPAPLAEARRAIGTISLYNFLLHGEQRDGNFDHGPYELGDGRRLLVRELSDLDNTYLPWSECERPLPCSNVCVAYALRDVEMYFTVFGGSVTDPTDFLANLEAGAVFTVESGEPRPLGPEEIEALAARSVELQSELFERVVGWEPVERSRYGTWLYANHLVPFLRLAGAEDLERELGERFAPIGEAAAAEFLAHEGLPEIFQDHARLGSGSMFSSLCGTGT